MIKENPTPPQPINKVGITTPQEPGVPVVNPVPTRQITISLPKTKMKVSEYRDWLKQELQKIASASDNDEIELN